MDYFKTPVDTDKNKLVDTDQPNCFIQQQWETMRTYCKARKSNEDEQFNFTVPNDIVDQFKKDCYALFDSL